MVEHTYYVPEIIRRQRRRVGLARYPQNVEQQVKIAQERMYEIPKGVFLHVPPHEMVCIQTL